MKQNGRYILCNLLVSLRRIVRFICKIIVFICIVCVVTLFIAEGWRLGLLIPIILGFMNYLFMIYYDKLIFKIKPDDIDITLFQ